MKKSNLSVSINGLELNPMSKAIKDKLLGNNDEKDYPTIGPEVDILAASLKGHFCHYTYEFTDGTCKGDSVNHKGTNIVHDDMISAFKKLHIHLAVKCEEIDKNDIKDIDNIPDWDVDAVHPKNLTQLQEVSRKVFHFSCFSYKSDGSGENEGVTLTGQKQLTTGEYVTLTSPKILWSGEYHFINELRVVIDDINEQVKLYRNGKFAPKFEQGELGFGDSEEIGDGKIED